MSKDNPPRGDGNTTRHSYPKAVFGDRLPLIGEGERRDSPRVRLLEGLRGFAVEPSPTDTREGEAPPAYGDMPTFPGDDARIAAKVAKATEPLTAMHESGNVRMAVRTGDKGEAALVVSIVRPDGRTEGGVIRFSSEHREALERCVSVLNTLEDMQERVSKLEARKEEP